MTLTLTWQSTTGSVRFNVTGAVAGQTVKRVTPGNTLQTVRGYGDSTWISGGSGIGYDYEMELGVIVRYALVDKAATTLPDLTGVTASINLATNPNLESGALTGWSTVSADYPVSIDTTAPISGTRSVVTIRGATASLTCSAVALSGQSAAYVPAAVGAKLTFAVDVKVELAGRRVRAFVQYYDGVSATQSGPTITFADPTTAGQTVRVVLTATIPAGFNSARIRILVDLAAGSSTTGERAWYDRLTVEAGATSGAYFDGDTADTTTYNYAWTEAVNASTSTRTPLIMVASVFTQTPGRENGEAWLRDILQPILSQPVSVLSTGDERRVSRQATYDIAGKPNPVVVWDSRTSRQGTITLAVQDHPVTGVWSTDTARDRMDALLSTGRPLLLSMCANLGFHPCYMAVADATYTRIGKGATWALQLDYVEVDNPVALGVYPVPDVTYAYAQQIPPNALYDDWTSVTYYDIATRTS